MTTGIYRFHVDCGRHGNLDGRFTATPEDIAFAVGHRLYFEEPWGKHSGVEVTLDADAFALVSDDPAEVATFAKLDMAHGECPLGLLHDSISDGRIELTAAQASAAPPYFREAIEANAERIERWVAREKKNAKKGG